MNIYLSCLFVVFCAQCYKCQDDEDYLLRGLKKTENKPKASWNETMYDKLKKDLLMNYDKYARPVEHYNVTEVKFGAALIHLETDELKSTITVVAFIRVVWSDPKLKWNEEDYDGIELIRLADHEIWQPDIYLYNSALGGEPMVRYGNPHALVYPNGEVLWVPPTRLVALCEFNLRHWPFDTQNCYLKFGSWTHSGNEIKLVLYNNRGLDLSDHMNYGIWNVSNFTSALVPKNYIFLYDEDGCVQLNFTLVRKTDSYEVVIITPAFVNALLIVMQFWLPTLGKERLTLNCVAATTSLAFLIYFTNQICAAGAATPLIVLFHSCSLLMVCLGMTGTVAAVWMSKMQKIQALVLLVKKQFKGQISKWLLLEFKIANVNGGAQEIQQIGCRRSSAFGSEFETVKLSSSSSKETEDVFVVLVNRILFLLYSLIYTIFGIVYLV